MASSNILPHASPSITSHKKPPPLKTKSEDWNMTQGGGDNNDRKETA